MALQQTPLSSVDEVLQLSDSPRYPVNVHIEIKVAGRLNANKLRKAVASALAVHPLARARLLVPRQQDKQLNWEITECAGIDPVLVLEGGNEARVNTLRNQLLSTQVPLHESPPLRIWLIRNPDGDHLVFNVSHAAADGLGTLRFTRSVMRAYNGEADDVGDIDPIEARNISQLYEADGRKQQRKRLKSLMASLKEQKQTPNGLCPRGAADRTGYGCYHLTLDVDTVALLNPKRHTRATFNDLLVAALHRTVEVWNAQQDNDCDLVRVSSPVNLRPKDWWFEVFGNFASAFATNSTRTERKNPKRLLNTIARQTRVAKDEGYAEAMLLALDLNTRIPVWMKNLLFQQRQTDNQRIFNQCRTPARRHQLWQKLRGGGSLDVPSRRYARRHGYGCHPLPGKNSPGISPQL